MPAAVRRRSLLVAGLIALVACAGAAGRSARAATANARTIVVIALNPYGTMPGDWSCLPGNPSCTGQDPWWQEYLAQPPGEPDATMQFTPLGSGFSVDARLAEAVLWLWRWPEGRSLLRTAALRGVSARFASLPFSSGGGSAVARYDARARALQFDWRFATAPSWLLGDVLAHELTHAAQDAAGQQLDANQAACANAELPARRTEVAYLRDLFAQLGSPPANAASALSAAGRELYAAVQGLLASNDLAGLVAGLCARGGF